jgi:hypothetical protein
MLLVGGLRAWCKLVRENPLRPVAKIEDRVVKPDTSLKVTQPLKQRRLTDVADVGQGIDKLDLEAESQWLDSLQSERLNSILLLSNMIEAVLLFEALVSAIRTRESLTDQLSYPHLRRMTLTTNLSWIS